MLKITGNSEEAKATVDEILAKLKELDKDTLATITVNADEAKKDIDDVEMRLKALSKRDLILIQIDANTAALDKAQAKLDKLRAEAAMSDITTPAGAASTMKAGSAARQVESLRTSAKGLESDLAKTGTTADRVLNKMTGEFGSVAGGIAKGRQALTSLVSDLVGKVPLVGGLFSSLAEGVGKLATTLLPEAAGGFASIAVQALSLGIVAPILLAITAAAASLVVTLGMVLAAVVALGIAFIVALGPILLVLGAVAYHVMKAISGTNALAQATAALKTAYTALAQSVVTLHNAQQQQSLQRIAALADEKTATLALTDAENAQKDALLGETSAKLAAQSARLALAQFNLQLAGFGTSPAQLAKRASGVDVTTGGQKQTGADPLGYKQLLIEYQQAVLAVKTADQGVHDATAAAADSANTLALAHAKVNLYLKMGLKAYPAYLQAVNATASAVTAWQEAENGLTQSLLAHQMAAKGIDGGTTQFMKAFGKLKKAFSAIFGPAERAVFAGIDKALTILAGHGKSLAPAFTNLGEAIGSAFVNFAKWMTSPGTMKDLGKIINDAAGLTRKLSHVFNEVFTIVNKIAVDVLPSLVSWIGNAGKVLESVVKHPKAIAKFLKLALGDLRQFGSAVSGFLGVIAKLAGYWHSIAKDVTTLKNFLNPFHGSATNPKTALGQALKAGIPKDKTGLDPTGTGGGPIQKFISLLGKLAGGGVVTGPGAYMIGEGGAPEGVIPLAGAGAQMVGRALALPLASALRGLMAPAGYTPAGALTQGAASHLHTHNWHLNQGNQVSSDEHFMAAAERRLAGGGTGYR
jgi:hypothetical protein